MLLNTYSLRIMKCDMDKLVKKLLEHDTGN